MVAKFRSFCHCGDERSLKYFDVESKSKRDYVHYKAMLWDDEPYCRNWNEEVMC